MVDLSVNYPRLENHYYLRGLWTMTADELVLVLVFTRKFPEKLGRAVKSFHGGMARSGPLKINVHP